MKTAVVASQKGGVGKTTLALNLAFSLARASFRVVLIDADPQGAVGHSLQGVRQSAGLYGLLREAATLDEALLHTRVNELSIVPVGNVPPERAHEFANQLADGAALGEICSRLDSAYDLALIDTPSGFGGATLGALRAAHYVLSPLQAEPVALKTLPQLLALLGALRGEGVDIELAAIVLCMLQQRNADSLAVAEEVWTRMPRELVVETTIPRDPTVLAASAAGVPLGLLSRLRPPPLALVFDQLALELAPRLGLTSEGDDGPVGLFA